MIMRNVNTGAFEVYDIANNSLTNAFFMGAVGLDWQVAGFGPISGVIKDSVPPSPFWTHWGAICGE